MTTKTEPTSRLAFLDISKAILILLVIIGHVLIFINPSYVLPLSAVQSFIYAFHMPAFFLLHGVVINREKWKTRPVGQYIWQRVYGLLIPYLFFETLGILCRRFLYGQPLTNGLLNLVTIRCNVGADWFLPAMFLGCMLFWIYIKWPNRIYGIVSTVVCLVLPMWMSGNQLLIVLGRGLLAYGFIMIGDLGKQLFLSPKLKKPLVLLAALAVTLICAACNLKFGGNDFFTCTLNNPVTLIIGGVSGTCLVIGCSCLLSLPVLAEAGRHTLTVMGTHQLIIYIAAKFIPLLSQGNVLRGIILLIAIILIEIPLVLLLDRYLPFLVGRKGRRRIAQK